MSAICSFEKFTSAYLFQIAREQSFDYLLIIYKWQFLSRFSILRDKWMVRLLQLYWMKIWHVNSSVKFIHSLQVMYENCAVSLLLVKSSLHSHLNSRTWPESKREIPCGFDAAFFKTVFRVVKKTVPCSSLSSQRNSLFNQHKFLSLIKCRETKLKLPRNGFS